MTHAWSHYQQAVYDVLVGFKDSVVVEALAGSGKSTLIQHGANECIPPEQSVRCLAFNKSIRDALRPKIAADIDVATFHSLGLKTCAANIDGTFKVDAQGKKKRDLAQKIFGRSYESKDVRSAFTKALGMAQNTLVADDPGAIDELLDTYGFGLPEGTDRDRFCTRVIEGLDALAFNVELIDFDDMVWLPARHGWRPRKVDVCFADEAQDLNAPQLWLTQRSSDRLIAVGDRHQAIYGFRGASSSSMDQIQRATQARRMPLSITYRCPLSVVELARTIVPALEARPDAPEGTVRYVKPEALDAGVQPGDMVLSRLNAPLVSACLRWIAQGRPAQIQGRDIGSNLASWVKGTRAGDIVMLTRCIDSWRDAEVKRLVELDRSTETVEDRAECLHALCSGAESVEEVLVRIGRIFGDKSGPRILLSSTHRAKGLEADRVWVLRDTYMKWPGPEEKNLWYVAVTRSKNELYVVTKEASE